MTTKVRVDLGDRKVIVKSQDDVEPILEYNAIQRTQSQKSDWGRHIASVPPIVCVMWLNECWERGHDIRFGSAEWYELVWRKLQDPDWKHLRTDK